MSAQRTKSRRLKGVVEADGTSVRTIRVSSKTKQFASLMKAWQKKHPDRKPKHFLAHCRMFGMIERNTSQNMVLAEAPLKLMPTGSKPPPESKEELRKTKLCQKLAPNATSLQMVHKLGLQ